MENTEEVMHILERFTRSKQKEIPKELDDYLQYVAKTGDTVYKWSTLKYLFREKLLNVIKHFHDTTQRVDEIPQYPNVDPFNYESMKSSLLERLDLFNAAPFTVQRLCELLIDPRKQYSRIDKFMRALEKNILVVSTIDPGRKHTESENGDSLDSVVNGDLSLDVNVDIDMENESLFNLESQNVSNGGQSTVEITADTKTKELDSETPIMLRTSDDDILPNPKKAKLDLNIDDEIAKSGNNVNNSLTEHKDKPLLKNVLLKEDDVSKIKSTNDEDVSSEVKEGERGKIKESVMEIKNLNENIEEQENIIEKATVEDIPEKMLENVDELKIGNELKVLDTATSKTEDGLIESEKSVTKEKIIEKDVIEKSEKEEKEGKCEEEKGLVAEVSKVEESEKKDKIVPNNTDANVDINKVVAENIIKLEVDKEQFSLKMSSDAKPVKEEILSDVIDGKDKNNDNHKEKHDKSFVMLIEKTETKIDSNTKSSVDKNESSTSNLISTANDEISEPVNKNVDKYNEKPKSLDIQIYSDHLMDENSGEIASAALNEVAMSKTITGITDCTSTDFDNSEVSKDEPAGMEIDDTSQEAMDQ